MAIFSEAELQRRFDVISTHLSSEGIDAAILTSADNVYYATGVPLLSEWGRPMWAVVFPARTWSVIGAAIEQENMQRDALTCDVLPYGDDENVWSAAMDLAMKALGDVAHNAGVVVGIEKSALPLAVFEQLKERLPGARFIDVSAVLFQARLIKSAEEERLLRIGGQLAQIGADAFLDALTPGVTELAVGGAAVRAMNHALGALYPEGITSTYAYAQFGEHTLSPHLHPTGRRLARGDVIALNVFPVITGYCVELERTLVYGPPTEEQGHYLSVLNEAFLYGKHEYQDGVRTDDLHARCSAIIASAGLEKYIRHGTGHAHGIMVGAASREPLGELRTYNNTTLKPGMTNSIEPGFYIPGSGGYRHSDVMFMYETGPECITPFPIELNL